jgi:hypothetical protein
METKPPAGDCEVIASGILSKTVSSEFPFCACIVKPGALKLSIILVAVLQGPYSPESIAAGIPVESYRQFP